MLPWQLYVVRGKQAYKTPGAIPSLSVQVLWSPGEYRFIITSLPSLDIIIYFPYLRPVKEKSKLNREAANTAPQTHRFHSHSPAEEREASNKFVDDPPSSPSFLNSPIPRVRITSNRFFLLLPSGVLQNNY